MRCPLLRQRIVPRALDAQYPPLRQNVVRCVWAQARCARTPRPRTPSRSSTGTTAGPAVSRSRYPIQPLKDARVV
eukprot:781135-Rhodomonas_salina.1